MQREKNNNFILDFTGVYDDEFAKEKTSLTWIDCTDITGCDMYVSDEAEKQIGERVDSVGIHGIHFLDSGNYHYVISLLLLNPIALISFFTGPTRISWQIYGLSLITFPAQSPQLVNPSIIGFCIYLG